ncbi:hypothetical protein C9426_05835 [Serratia sp. S1B]|nr:hypothetical protein C9426_05835 [Serratia sp. S1B]
MALSQPAHAAVMSAATTRLSRTNRLEGQKYAPYALDKEEQRLFYNVSERKFLAFASGVSRHKAL